MSNMYPAPYPALASLPREYGDPPWGLANQSTLPLRAHSALLPRADGRTLCPNALRTDRADRPAPTAAQPT
jgi:hypothetical protein